MKRRTRTVIALGALASLLPGPPAGAQYRDTTTTTAATPSATHEKGDTTVVLSLDDALRIALSENVSVKVADMEIQRSKYARRGAYGALFPQIDASGVYSYAIKKQKVFFGSDSNEGSSSGGGMASMMSSATEPIMYYIKQLYEGTGVPFVPYVAPETAEGASSSGGNAVEMGRSNQVQLGLTAAMPLVNFPLWQSLRLSGDQVEMAVEKARESRLGTVNAVKNAYYAVLLAKASYEVYQAVFDNAAVNLKLVESRHHVSKASEMDLARAQSSLAASIPNLYNAENAILLSLWQLKAVMGVDLDRPVDVSGRLEDYAGQMFRNVQDGQDAPLDGNAQMRQLERQAQILARQIRLQRYAYLPSLALQFSYNYYAQSDKFNMSQWQWMPSSTIALALNIPIFSGGQRLHAVRQARVQADELALQRTETERQLRIGIGQAVSTMETAMKTHDAAREAQKTAEKAFDIATKSYQVGKSTFTDLNNTELTLTQTRLQALQAIYNFVLAKASLEQTLGYDFTDAQGKTDLSGAYNSKP